jgi:hypothetical protein
VRWITDAVIPVALVTPTVLAPWVFVGIPGASTMGVIKKLVDNP